jgi:alkylation response protein AidB-like acyl-CoA dehydrogenase
VTSAAFALTDDQREILEQVERFAPAELYPLQQRMDDEEWWPGQTFRALGDNGYLGVMAPTELGGVGLDFFASVLVVQAVARWNPAIALSLLVHESLWVNNMLANGSAELLNRYIPGMCEGRLVGALALTAHRRVATRAAAVVLQAGRTFTGIADEALQVHGGAGYIWETEINRLYRAGKLWEIGAGTTQIRQLIVAQELLGL